MLMVVNVMEMVQMVSWVVTEIIEILLLQLIPMWQHALLGSYRQQEAKRYSGKISFKVPSKEIEIIHRLFLVMYYCYSYVLLSQFNESLNLPRC